MCRSDFSSPSMLQTWKRYQYWASRRMKRMKWRERKNTRPQLDSMRSQEQVSFNFHAWPTFPVPFSLFFSCSSLSLFCIFIFSPLARGIRKTIPSYMKRSNLELRVIIITASFKSKLHLFSKIASIYIGLKMSHRSCFKFPFHFFFIWV